MINAISFTLSLDFGIHVWRKCNYAWNLALGIDAFKVGYYFLWGDLSIHHRHIQVHDDDVKLRLIVLDGCF